MISYGSDYLRGGYTYLRDIRSPRQKSCAPPAVSLRCYHSDTSRGLVALRAAFPAVFGYQVV